MNSYDQTVWTQLPRCAPCRHGAADRVASLDDVPRLLGFSNYPWNKVVRTERYRRTGLTFGNTPVHNDILGHWQMLLDAGTLVLVDDPLCTHVVTEDGNNLTNREQRRPAHACSTRSMRPTVSWPASPELRNRYSHHYWDFALRVTGLGRAAHRCRAHAESSTSACSVTCCG